MKSRPAYFKRLLKFLRRKGRSHEDAEDLIQEAMLRLHLYGREVPVHNEEAFLRHAVTNLSIDQHRRNRPDLRKEVPIEELNAQSPLVSTESTPEEALEAHQRLGRIRAALDAVSLRTGEIYFAHRAGHAATPKSLITWTFLRITIRRHIARALLAIMEHGDRDGNGSPTRATE